MILIQASQSTRGSMLQFRARGAERMSSGELGSAKLSLYSAIPEILRSRSACQELDGLERGPLIGRGCAPPKQHGGNAWQVRGRLGRAGRPTRALQALRPTVEDVKFADFANACFNRVGADLDGGFRGGV